MTTKITRDFLKNFRVEFKDAVKSLEDKYGISIQVDNISFTDSSFSMKTKVALVKDGEDSELAVNREVFKRHCFRFGLSESSFGKVFTFRDQAYIIVGLSPKSRTYPILGKSRSGKVYKFPLDVVTKNIIE